MHCNDAFFLKVAILKVLDVVSFAEETLADIAAAVIPAIVDERLQCLPFMRRNLPRVKGAKKTKSFSFIVCKLLDNAHLEY